MGDIDQNFQKTLPGEKSQKTLPGETPELLLRRAIETIADALARHMEIVASLPKTLPGEATQKSKGAE